MRAALTLAGTADVVVVGAGLVGAMTAWRLAEAGARVTLIESEFAGSGSTGAAMGHLVAMDDSMPQLALSAYSRARWNALADELPAAGEHERCGTLWIAADERDLEVAAARVSVYATCGVTASVIDARGLYALEPALRPGLAGALHVPDDGVCYPPAVARWLCDRASDSGATVRHGVPVRRVEVPRVQLADGTTVSAGAIVIAAGVSSCMLVPGLPVVPRRGHLVITDRQHGLLRHQLIELGYLHSAHSFGGSSVAFNVQPRRTGQVLIGSSRELVGLDHQINHALVGEMLERALGFMPALAQARALRTWIGFRPATADKLPLIGAWGDAPGLWIATGHEGLGITMATGTADLLVAGILGQAPPVDPAPFRPDRAMPLLAAAA